MKTVITSMNRKLFNFYGQKFIDTWKSNASKDVNLIISYEGNKEDIINYKSDSVFIIDFESKEYKLFIKKYGGFSEARGIMLEYNTTNTPGQANYFYNYRFDAIRFAFKIFSIKKCIDLNLITNDFAWLDADVVCLRKFSSSDLDQFFPNDEEIISYLGRDNFPKPNPYSECGFVGFNFKHKETLNFISKFLNLYTQGDLFLCKEWHDSFLFDVCRRNFESNGFKFKNLASHIKNEEHPFMKTNLGLFFDHLKGPVRKKQGHS